jgi:hypothetical protein
VTPDCDIVLMRNVELLLLLAELGVLFEIVLMSSVKCVAIPLTDDASILFVAVVRSNGVLNNIGEA